MSAQAPTAEAVAEAPRFELSTSRQFSAWLAETGASLALSTYQSGKLILLGTKREDGKLSIFERSLERPMGIAAAGPRLAVAGLYQITTFVDAMGPNDPPAEGGFDACYVPQSASFTADLDVHGMAHDAEGRLVFVNTLFSCLATTSETHSFRPLWRPRFWLHEGGRVGLDGFHDRFGKADHTHPRPRVRLHHRMPGWPQQRRCGGQREKTFGRFPRLG